MRNTLLLTLDQDGRFCLPGFAPFSCLRPTAIFDLPLGWPGGISAMVLVVLTMRGDWLDAAGVLAATVLLLVAGLGGAAIACETRQLCLGIRQGRALRAMGALGAGFGYGIWLLVIGWEAGRLTGVWSGLA